jgi:hypothetical protein
MEEFTNKPMIVMQVRPEFSVQYKASPKIKFKKEHLISRKEFVEFLSKASKNWKEGNYFLRSDLGPFAAFDVNRGKRINLHKENKNNVPYLCWSILSAKK